MKEEKEKQKNNSATSSKIQAKNEQSNEELLEQILNKKKAKKTTKKTSENVKATKKEKELLEDEPLIKTTSKKSSTSKKGSKPKNTKKAQEDLSSDELLESIIAKKKQKSSKEKSTTKKNSKSNISKKTKEELSADELVESIIAKKEQKSTKQKSTSKKIVPEEIEQAPNDNKKIETTEEIKEKKEKDQRDLIITRKIVFDDVNLNLKSKKTLKELKNAIEEFDRLETLTEIAESSDKINDLNKTDIFDETSIDNDIFKTSKIVFDKRSDRHKKNNEKESVKKELPSDDYNNEFEYIKDFGNFEPEEVRPHKLNKKSRFDKHELNTIIMVLFSVILIAILILVLYLYINNKGISNSSKLDTEIKNIVEQDNSNEIALKYQECLQSEFTEEDYTEEISEAVLNLTEYLKTNYKSSVLYEDLTTGFTYNYNKDTVYYAASTIKVLDALYIYTKAAKGELDLDEIKLEYKSKFKAKSSKGMSQYKYGEKVSLRNLVKYAIVYSDNSAHQMLVDYIGRSTLKEFGQSLGAQYTLVGSDNFGSINVEDAIIYMKATNDFIKNNEELGEELNFFLIIAEQNDLEIPSLNIEAAHKYGSYGSYYHDYGIVYDEHPYVIAILTSEGKDDYEAKVKDINLHLYELHKLFYTVRENTCKAIFYE